MRKWMSIALAWIGALVIVVDVLWFLPAWPLSSAPLSLVLGVVFGVLLIPVLIVLFTIIQDWSDLEDEDEE